MTNFEKWKDEILKINKYGSAIAVVNGKPINCGITDCDLCEFNPRCNECRINWLYSEYTEPKPKLTKRERAFCEALYDMVDIPSDFNVGRTGVGNLYLAVGDRPKFCLDNTSFKFIECDGELSIKDLMKLEVEE